MRSAVPPSDKGAMKEKLKKISKKMNPMMQDTLYGM